MSTDCEHPGCVKYIRCRIKRHERLNVPRHGYPAGRDDLRVDNLVMSEPVAENERLQADFDSLANTHAVFQAASEARIAELEAYTNACEDLDPPDVLVHWKTDRARIAELERERDAARAAAEQVGDQWRAATDEVRRLGEAIGAAIVELERAWQQNYVHDALAILRAAKTGGSSG